MHFFTILGLKFEFNFMPRHAYKTSRNHQQQTDSNKKRKKNNPDKVCSMLYNVVSLG